MTKKTTEKPGNFKRTLKKALPYLCIYAIVIPAAFWGSLGKKIDTNSEVNIQSLASNNYSASADQISEFYIVSELASTMNLATAEAVNLNYNSLTTLAESSQTTSDKFEKPTNITGDCEFETGAVRYTVSEGESIASIASRYASCGVDETMIRWSNNYKNSVQVKAGDIIYVPARAGFVHKVKNGETVVSLAEKYGSVAEEIISSNGLEKKNLSVDSYILIPNGNLPENERPDYVAPTRRPAANNSAYRIYWTKNNPMPWGWCTWYAWARRAQMGGNMTLPGGLGNANTWDNSLSRSFYMDGTPRAGDVFQTDAGYYGHVGIVEKVNGDGTITISDMNGIAGWGRVGTKTISNWHQYKFIHQRK